MISRLLLISVLVVGPHLNIHAFVFNSSDTTRIAHDLDSAFGMMKRVDPQAVPFLSRLLEESRKESFKRGEAESLFCLGEYYSIKEEGEKSWQYFDSARIRFEALDHKARLAQSLNMMGSLLVFNSKFVQAVPYYEKAAQLNEALGRKQQIADCYYNLADAHRQLGDYVKALEYDFKVVKIDEELGYREGVADDYGHIGNIYEKIGDIPKSIESHKKSIEVAEATGNQEVMASSYTHYGLLLKNTGKFEESRVMLQKALELSKDLKPDRWVSIALHNMAALLYAEGRYRDAIRFYNESLSYNVGAVESATHEGLAQAYLKLKDYTKATAFAKQSLRAANESKAMDSQKKVNLLLSDIAAAEGNYKLSLDYYKQYTTIKDSLLNSEKTRQIEDMQAKYETDKKEQEIATLTQERQLQEASIRQKNYIQYALVIGVIVLIAFGLVTFRIFRGRQEARRELLAQQLKAEHQETERVRELERMKSRFFANIAHEFRTPLTLILGPLENIISKSDRTPEQEQLKLVKNNASRLVKLVNQLLDLSKLEAGAVKVEYVHEDIIPFLKSLAYSFQSLAEQKNIAIRFVNDPSSVFTRFDRDKLEKIFSNLLSNAFKFTPDGGQVAVAVTAKDSAMIITVSDSGPGISTADIPFIFNRFYQSGTAVRNTTGSGIGLELTRELVEICGGSITVANIPSGGAQFTVILPVASDQPEHAPKTSVQPVIPTMHDHPVEISSPAENSKTDDTKDTVLVIEDNQEVRDFVVQSLIGRYNVITAEHGGEGISKAIATIPDLIITDVMMPVKDGMEVCRTLKGEQETSHIPIIMLTAKADVESKIEGLETGADDYLPKPFHTRELLTRMQNLIQNRERLREKFRVASSTQTETQPVTDTLPPRERQFLKRLHEVIELHLAEEEYGVEELSDDMNMSRMQLHRKVKAITDTPPSLYIRTIRLERGKQLLEEGLYNVSEVAYRVGFNSPTYFSTCFSERYGFPPSEVKVGVAR